MTELAAPREKLTYEQASALVAQTLDVTMGPRQNPQDWSQLPSIEEIDARFSEFKIAEDTKTTEETTTVDNSQDNGSGWGVFGFLANHPRVAQATAATALAGAAFLGLKGTDNAYADPPTTPGLPNPGGNIGPGGTVYHPGGSTTPPGTQNPTYIAPHNAPVVAPTGPMPVAPLPGLPNPGTTPHEVAPPPVIPPEQPPIFIPPVVRPPEFVPPVVEAPKTICMYINGKFQFITVPAGANFPAVGPENCIPVPTPVVEQPKPVYIAPKPKPQPNKECPPEHGGGPIPVGFEWADYKHLAIKCEELLLERQLKEHDEKMTKEHTEQNVKIDRVQDSLGVPLDANGKPTDNIYNQNERIWESGNKNKDSIIDAIKGAKPGKDWILYALAGAGALFGGVSALRSHSHDGEHAHVIAAPAAGAGPRPDEHDGNDEHNNAPRPDGGPRRLVGIAIPGTRRPEQRAGIQAVPAAEAPRARVETIPEGSRVTYGNIEGEVAGPRAYNRTRGEWETPVRDRDGATYDFTDRHMAASNVIVARNEAGRNVQAREQQATLTEGQEEALVVFLVNLLGASLSEMDDQQLEHVAETMGRGHVEAMKGILVTLGIPANRLQTHAQVLRAFDSFIQSLPEETRSNLETQATRLREMRDEQRAAEQAPRRDERAQTERPQRPARRTPRQPEAQDGNAAVARRTQRQDQLRNAQAGVPEGEYRTPRQEARVSAVRLDLGGNRRISIAEGRQFMSNQGVVRVESISEDRQTFQIRRGNRISTVTRDQMAEIARQNDVASAALRQTPAAGAAQAQA